MHPSPLAIPSRHSKTVLFLLTLGAGAGFLNGLLGTGGGILLVYVLRGYAAHHRRSTATADESQRDIYATALAVMLPLSIFSALQYARIGSLDFSLFAPMLLPTLAGGIAGGWLLDRLKLQWLGRLFALLVLISGILMIVRA